MRAFLLLAMVLVPLPSSAGSRPRPSYDVCYYDSRARTAYTKTFDCYDSGQARLYSGYNTNGAELISIGCGVRNVANRLSTDICENPCASAIRGMRNFAAKGKTVLIGPTNLPTGPDSRFAFGLYEGSCSQLDRAVKESPGLKRPPTDGLLLETLINAAVDEAPAQR